MSDSVAWCILAGFKITSVFSRITYHIIESICEFVVSILEEYMHRGNKTLTTNATKKVQKKKGKAAIKLIEAGCQNEEESKTDDYNANKPTVTRKIKTTEDKNGDKLTISGQRFRFQGTDKVEYNLREARKVTVSFDFYPFQDQSTLELNGPSRRDRTSDTQNETTGNVPASDEPLLPTSSNKISDQPSEKEATRMYGLKSKGDFVLDDYCPDQNVIKTDYKNHTTKHAEDMKLGVGSKDRTDSINQRCDASNDKMQGKGDPNQRHPASPVYTKQCPAAPLDQIQGTAAHIDEHAEHRWSLVPFVCQIVDQKRDYEATGYQMQDLEPTFDQKQDMKITCSQMQIPEAIVDRKKDSESTIDKKQYLATAVDKKPPEAAIAQMEGPKAVVDEMEPGTDVEEFQGPEATVNLKDPATDDDQKRKEVTVDQKQNLESTVDQNQGHATVVYQKQDQVTTIVQSTDKKQGPPAFFDSKSSVDLTDKQQSKVGTIDQSTDKKGSPVTVDKKQGGGATFNKKNAATDPGKKNRGSADPDEKKVTVFKAEKKQVSKVLTDNKRGAALPMDKKQNSKVTVDKKQKDKTFVEKTGTAASVERNQSTAVLADKKKGASAPVSKKEGLDIPVVKKQGSAVSVDQKKDSLALIDKIIDKKKGPAATSGSKQGSAAHVHPATSQKNDPKPATCKEQVDSKQELGYTPSAADRKSVSKGIKDKNNLKCPQGGFREGEATQTFAETCNETKVLESASEGFARTEIGISEILSEESQSASGVEKVPETSGSANGVEPDSEMICANDVELVSEASKEVENFADISEVSRKDDTHKLVSEVLEDHKAVEPDSKTHGNENNSGLDQESLAHRFSHQRKSTESNDSSATSDEDSVYSSDNSLEKGPSIVIAPDVLLDPYIPLNMSGITDEIEPKIIEKEYLQDEWDDTDKYFYDHVIEREKEMGHVDPSTFAKEPSAQKAVLKTKNKEKKKSQKEEHQSQKSYGKIVDIYNPMTELPKYYDVISVVDSKYLLQKSDIKCYTKQEVTDDSKTVEREEENISRTEGLVEIEQRNNETQSPKATGSVNILAEAAVELERQDSVSRTEDETPETSGKTYAEMGARPRTNRRRNQR